MKWAAHGGDQERVDEKVDDTAGVRTAARSFALSLLERRCALGFDGVAPSSAPLFDTPPDAHFLQLLFKKNQRCPR